MKTAEKTDKPAAKSTAKIFDVAHPGKSAPSSSSRPVIITNRPIMQDPMMSSQSAESPLSMKPAEKITIKPLIQSDEPTRDEEKTSASSQDEEKNASDAIAESVEIAAKAEETEEIAATEVEITPPADADTDDEAVEASKSTEDAEPSKTKDAGESDGSDEPAGTPAEDGTNADDKDKKELAALEAKAKQEEEIAKLVEAKQYFLPINSLERRRSKIISLLGLALIVVLGLALLDLMLDAGMVHVPGASSVTHFFS